MAAGYNEGKAIDAVLRRIEARVAELRRGDGWSPDDQSDPDKDRRVDYVCTIGDQLYAFEHTGIEPFENQIEMEVHNRNLFEPVVAHFANKVPAREYWELHSPVEASVGISGGKIKQVQNALIGWITANASALPVTRFGDRYPYSAQKESTPGVPFRFALYRSSVPDCGLSGVFWRREGISGNLEDARRSRLERVCDDKFAKLAKWKRDEGARSILVMEENDLSSTNHQLVAEAMARAEAGRHDTPDEIFLVSTIRPNPWWVTCLRRDGANYYDDGERFHELDPVNLTQLTSR
ncbi:MAG: hypothetical protein P4L00_01460 [Candidatus Acidoferrales bacterium]|nr:hypothetical protein [Xanthobacteraceae bacterium]MDR3720240.1 hypothetical protein [Candidatus Acidoferrales bacterium]